MHLICSAWWRRPLARIDIWKQTFSFTYNQSMIVIFHAVVFLVNEYFTPELQRNVRDIAREVVFAMSEDWGKTLAHESLIAFFLFRPKTRIIIQIAILAAINPDPKAVQLVKSLLESSSSDKRAAMFSRASSTSAYFFSVLSSNTTNSLVSCSRSVLFAGVSHLISGSIYGMFHWFWLLATEYWRPLWGPFVSYCK